MRTSCLRGLICVAVVGFAAGCSKSSDPHDVVCGGAGQQCCYPVTCNAGLACQAGTCRAGTVACGAQDQACCATGIDCTGALACEAGFCRAPLRDLASKQICAEGGGLAVTGAALTIPRGALQGCATVRLARTDVAPPSGYGAYSPVFQLEPAGLRLAVPASLRIDVPTADALAAPFWSSESGTAFDLVPGALAGGAVTAEISRFGSGFVAGRDYVNVCESGGTLAIAGATLTIPAGAVGTCTMVRLAPAAVPAGYTPLSAAVRVEPEMELRVPASLALEFTPGAEAAVLFWMGATSTRPALLPGVASSGTFTASLTRFGQGFVAGRDRVEICQDGGEVSVSGATLTIPRGALTSCTLVRLSRTSDEAVGYTPYSAVYRIEPEDVVLHAPASLSIDFVGDANLATAFWSRVGTTGFERASTTVEGARARAQITRFGRGLVADGVTYTDPPDRSCVVSRMIDDRTLEPADALAKVPSAVALFYTVDDCWGRPIPGLAKSDFLVRENGANPSVESSSTFLPKDGVEIFTSLVIDVSESARAHLPSVIESAKSFVTDLQVTRHLPVQIDIQIFAGERESTVWQKPTLDTDLLRTRLDALATHDPDHDDPPHLPVDRASTNLNGAVVDGLLRLAAARSDFEDRNRGGAFTIGYLVLFTDGKDNANIVTPDVVLPEVRAATSHIVAVGLESPDYDPTALAALAPDGVITAPQPSQLSMAFAAVANRMASQLDRFYLLGYCSPKRAGRNTVSVTVAGATAIGSTAASTSFVADSFGQGCTAATFTSVCEGRECGGLGCGACDDRVAACSDASLCVSHCLTQNLCADQAVTFTNKWDYEQTCVASRSNAACGDACYDLTRDPSHCGDCATVCGTGQRCVAGVCAD